MAITDGGGSGKLRKIIWAWTADGAGAVVAETTTAVITGQIESLETDPGSTAPTANYAITVKNVQGTDLLNGAGANRSATANELAYPVVNSVPVPVPVRDSKLTFALTGNAVASATGVAVLYIIQP